MLNPSKKLSVWLCGYVMKQDNVVFIFNAYWYNAAPPLLLPYSLPHPADTINAFVLFADVLKVKFLGTARMP